MQRSPLTREGSQSPVGLPSLEHQCQKSATYHLAVKIRGDSDMRVRQRAGGNPGVPLKRLCTNSHLQALTLGSGGRRAAWGVPETYREKLSYVALGRRLEGWGHCLCVGPSTHITKSESALA